MISRLNKLLPQTTNNSGVGEPLRERQRVNIDDSDEETILISSGHWVLLDEVNLAPVEILDHLVSLINHSLVIVPNEEGETVRAANSFALFAAMNPPTDFGKRPLAKELRYGLTEFYVEDIDDQDDLEILFAHRLFGLDCLLRIRNDFQLMKHLLRAMLRCFINLLEIFRALDLWTIRLDSSQDSTFKHYRIC